MDIFEYWQAENYEYATEYVHSNDISVLHDLSYMLDSSLDFSFPPGPFFGPLKTAKVILCYGNPGIDDPSVSAITSPASHEILINQLSGESEYPHILSGWRQWFSQKANSLFDGNIELAGKNVAIFNLIPYASKNMDHISKIANCLPSVWAAQDHLRKILIPKAKAGKILLVMCRSSNLWGLKSSHNCRNILINDSRTGFNSEIKGNIKNWLRSELI